MATDSVWRRCTVVCDARIPEQHLAPPSHCRCARRRFERCPCDSHPAAVVVAAASVAALQRPLAGRRRRGCRRAAAAAVTTRGACSPRCSSRRASAGRCYVAAAARSRGAAVVCPAAVCAEDWGSVCRRQQLSALPRCERCSPRPRQRLSRSEEHQIASTRWTGLGRRSPRCVTGPRRHVGALLIVVFGRPGFTRSLRCRS
jgi:hypothetical protein